MKKAILILACLAASTAWADWKRFVAQPDGSVVSYIDTATIIKEGENIFLWQLYNLKDADSRGMKSYKVRAELDCKGQRARYTEDQYFSGGMATGSLLNTNLTSHDWRSPVRDDISSLLLKAHCKN